MYARNPECHHFMGYQQYDDLKKMTQRSYCKSKFTEKKNPLKNEGLIP